MYDFLLTRGGRVYTVRPSSEPTCPEVPRGGTCSGEGHAINVARRVQGRYWRSCGPDGRGSGVTTSALQHVAQANNERCLFGMPTCSLAGQRPRGGRLNIEREPLPTTRAVAV